MINEEYKFEDVETYLYDTIDLLIVGSYSSDEERGHFFYDKWTYLDKDILVLERIDGDELKYIIKNKSKKKKQ